MVNSLKNDKPGLIKPAVKVGVLKKSKTVFSYSVGL